MWWLIVKRDTIFNTWVLNLLIEVPSCYDKPSIFWILFYFFLPTWLRSNKLITNKSWSVKKMWVLFFLFAQMIEIQKSCSWWAFILYKCVNSFLDCGLYASHTFFLADGCENSCNGNGSNPYLAKRTESTPVWPVLEPFSKNFFKEIYGLQL